MSSSLLLGDCIEKMGLIADESVDLIVTSPPYNNWRNRRTQKRKEHYWKRTNIHYDTFNDKMSDEDYEKWQIKVLDECARVLKRTGTICYNHKDRIFNFEVLSPLSWLQKTINFQVRQRITWDRCGMQAFNPVRFYRTEEDIYILGHNGVSDFKWNKECAKYLSVWRIPPARKNGHPAPFPLEIPRRCILSFTDEGDTVLDPFMGSGTVGVACKELNRKFIGIDISEKYVEMARRNLDVQG